MGSATDNYRLRWNDFASNVTGAFTQLRSDGDFFDVSLTCDGSAGLAPLRAHKVILSASSPVFKEMLRGASSSSMSTAAAPLVVYLRGISHRDLESVLDFVYRGEVNIAQDALDAFLAVAEDLQIKGLAQGEDNKANSQSRKQIPPPPLPPPPPRSADPPAKRPRRSTADEADDSNDVIDVKDEPVFDRGGGSGVDPYDGGDGSSDAVYDEQEFGDYAAEDGDGGGDVAQGDADPSSGVEFRSDAWRLHILSLPDGMGRCVPCNKMFKRLPAAKRHYEVFHVGATALFECCYCKKHFHEFAFRTHLNSKHSIVGVKNAVKLYGKRV